MVVVIAIPLQLSGVAVMVMTGIACHLAAVILVPQMGMVVVDASLDMDVAAPHLGAVRIDPQLGKMLVVHLPHLVGTIWVRSSFQSAVVDTKVLKIWQHRLPKVPSTTSSPSLCAHACLSIQPTFRLEISKWTK